MTAAAGHPVAQARVEVVGGDVYTFTDAGGGFVLAGVEPPVELRVVHVRYRTAEVAVTGDEAGPVEILLEAKQELYEAISVSASRAPEGDATPSTLAASVIDPLGLPVPPATLTDAVRTVPGVAENGQGGLFQAFSIRGVSRQRVLTLVSGMQITSERRAGVATSFLDPRILGEVEVVRGPASTWYGSGALGGVVEVFPRRYQRLTAEAGWESAGDERYAAAGWGDGDWSLALAHRAADDAETPDGERLFSRYRRTSASLLRTWGGGEAALWRLTVLPSLTTGIGKPNADFPREITEYPRERHLLAKLSVTAPDGSRAYLWLHPHDLETRSTEPDQVAEVDNGTVDLGANAQRELTLGRRLRARLGVDYFGRRDVTAEEVRRDRDGTVVDTARTLDGARLDEAAGYGSLSWAGPGVTLTGGARFTWQRQENGGVVASSRDDTAWSGFLGATAGLPAGFQVTANLGTGLRFPSLSERFFTGTTGRGEVIGSEDLEPERSLNGDLGLAWFGERLFLRGHLFRTEIDDYVERITLEPGVRTFVNLTSGTLEGIELEGDWMVADGWTASANAHLIDGEDDAGRPLADVPPGRLRITVAADPAAGLAGGKLSFQLAAEARDEVDDPGSGERTIPDALLLAASARYRLSDALELTLRGTNLGDETWFPSADELAVPAPGRSVGLALVWGGG